SGETGLDSDFRRLFISDLADEDDVRSLPQHRPDDAGEVQADLVFHLHLVDTGQVILDRILRGDDLSIRPVQFVEGAVEGRGLAGARRARDQEDAVRSFDDLLKALKVLLAEPQVANPYLDVAAVKNTHHDGLTVNRRKHADAEVEVLAVDAHLDPAVLGPAL